MALLLSSTATSASRLTSGLRLCPVTCRKHPSQWAVVRRQDAAQVATFHQAQRIPFAKGSYNLTEQSRLYRTDRDMYERLKAAANR